MHWVLFNSKFLGSVRKLNVCSRGGSPQDTHPKIAKHRLYLYRLHLIFLDIAVIRKSRVQARLQSRLVLVSS